MSFLKKLYNLLFSVIFVLISPFYHLLYRLYLTALSFFLYCRYPRLTLLECLFLLEETIRFILLPVRLLFSLFSPNKSKKPIYGTVSFSGINQIAKKLSLYNYQVCDIGSGKGKLLFFLAIAYHCRCTGIENHRSYVFTHKLAAFLLGLSHRVTLIEADLMRAPLPHADVYFVLGLGFSPETLSHIQEQLVSLVETRIVVSVGILFPALSAYLKETVSIAYSWGYCDTYIYHSIDSISKA